MSHRSYRRLGHRALGLLPFGSDERVLLCVTFVGIAALAGVLISLCTTALVAVALLAHRRAHDGRMTHLRALQARMRPRRYARRVPDPIHKAGDA
jgi:hypothetical protein